MPLPSFPLHTKLKRRQELIDRYIEEAFPPEEIKKPRRSSTGWVTAGDAEFCMQHQVFL
jgi:hypothetical protein